MWRRVVSTIVHGAFQGFFEARPFRDRILAGHLLYLREVEDRLQPLGRPHAESRRGAFAHAMEPIVTVLGFAHGALASLVALQAPDRVHHLAPIAFAFLFFALQTVGQFRVQHHCAHLTGHRAKQTDLVVGEATTAPALQH